MPIEIKQLLNVHSLALKQQWECAALFKCSLKGKAKHNMERPALLHTHITEDTTRAQLNKSQWSFTALSLVERQATHFNITQTAHNVEEDRKTPLGRNKTNLKKTTLHLWKEGEIKTNEGLYVDPSTFVSLLGAFVHFKK